MLGFHQLIQVSVKGILADVGGQTHLRVFVALPHNASMPLLQISGPPRAVQIMQADQPLLDVGTGPHLEGGANQDTHLTGADLLKQGFPLGLGFGGVNEGDLPGRHSQRHQLVFEIVIHIEAAIEFWRG